jgi:hypothetical protein
MRVYLWIVCMLFSFSSISCWYFDYDDEEQCEHAPDSCESTPYTQGDFTVTYTLNAENPAVILHLYRGVYDGSPECTPPVTVGPGAPGTYSYTFPALQFSKYTARIIYKYNGVDVEAFDSDSVVLKSETYCEGKCYELENGSADCTFDASAYDKYDSGNDDAKCFIATAAYGSSFAPKVKILREFRNAYLLTNAPGREFVQWYYRVSPPLAGVIANNNYLRMMTRDVLTPIVFVIEYPAVLLGIPLVLILFFTRKRCLSKQ